MITLLAHLLAQANDLLITPDPDDTGRTAAALITQALDAMHDAAAYHAKALDARATDDADGIRYNDRRSGESYQLAVLRITQLAALVE